MGSASPLVLCAVLLLCWLVAITAEPTSVLAADVGEPDAEEGIRVLEADVPRLGERIVIGEQVVRCEGGLGSGTAPSPARWSAPRCLQSNLSKNHAIQVSPCGTAGKNTV